MIIGYAIVNELGATYVKKRILLLSPAAGLGTAILIAEILSRAGVPVSNFARPLAVGLVASGLAYLVYRRERIRPRAFGPWVIVSCLFLLLLGWPSISCGYDWVSFSNGDMLFYASGANFLFKHGLYQIPQVDALISRRDNTWETSFLYSIGQFRMGSQLLLAMAMELAGRTAVEAYMPVLLAVHLVILLTAAAMLTTNEKNSRLAIIGAIAVGCSSTLAQGTYNQLLPQMLGIVELLAATTVIMDSVQTRCWRQAALGGIFAAALLAVYPELVPFLVAPILLQLILSAVIELKVAKRRVIYLCWLLAFTGVFANVTAIGALHLMLWAIGVGEAGLGTSAELFPYYLTPLGFGLLWGLFPYGANSVTSLGEQAILVVGMIFYLLSIVIATARLRFLEASSTISFVMLIGMIQLYMVKSGFGLQKLAMYMQPFVLVMLVATAADAYRYCVESRSLWRRCLNAGSAVALVACIAYLFLNIEVTLRYGVISLGVGSTLSEMPGWTAHHAVSQLKMLATMKDKEVVSDAYDGLVAGYEAVYEEAPTFFFARNYSGFDVTSSINPSGVWEKLLGDYKFRANIQPAIAAYNRVAPEDVKLTFGSPFEHYNDVVRLDPRLLKASIDSSNTSLFMSMNPTLFNRWRQPQQMSQMSVKPYRSVQNFLIRVPSNRTGFDENVKSRMAWGIESDPEDSGRFMEAFGRYALFNVVNPTGPVRMELALTTSFQGDRENELPDVVLLGKTKVAFPSVGHGAARVFSQEIMPINSKGMSFFELDFGRDGRQFPYSRYGVMRLFGTRYNFDYRRVVGFIRDISIVPESVYKGIRPPMLLSNCHKDLANPEFSFSGIYDDCWLADHARFSLSEPLSHGTRFSLDALVPKEEGALKLKIRVRLDGKTVISDTPRPGVYSRSVSTDGDGRPHVIDVYCSPMFHLPHDDERPASILLEKAGFSER